MTHMKYIVHLGTGTVVAADDCVVVDVTLDDLDEEAIVELASMCGDPVVGN